MPEFEADVGRANIDFNIETYVLILRAFTPPVPIFSFEARSRD